MANLGFLVVCNFGNFPASVLVAVHTVNNLDPGNEKSFKNVSKVSTYILVMNKLFQMLAKFQAPEMVDY